MIKSLEVFGSLGYDDSITPNCSIYYTGTKNRNLVNLWSDTFHKTSIVASDLEECLKESQKHESRIGKSANVQINKSLNYYGPITETESIEVKKITVRYFDYQTRLYKTMTISAKAE